ncbi:MAG TPA: hypothetical protein VGO00_13970 [Kofleriaceae bacterium]|nr:hypothetical protein [Kofleriaceae bacterium]
MARGIARAPSHNAYRGAIGKTTQTVVHVTGPDGDLIAASVFTTIDAVSDPDLVDRLHSDDPGRALNAIRGDSGEMIRISVPVLYHDPAAELMVLVLGEAHRHREIDERISVLQRLRVDDEAIPAYVKDFAVVFGPGGLRAYLERRAQTALDTSRMMEQTRDIDRRRADLTAREAEIDRRSRELERRAFELDAGRSELERHRVEIDQMRSAARARVIATATRNENEIKTVVAPMPVMPTGDARRENSEPEIRTSPVRKTSEHSVVEPNPPVLPPSTNGTTSHSSEISIEFGDEDDETTGSSIIPQGSDPLTTETEELALPEDATAPGATTGIRVEGGVVRLSIVANEQVARGLGGIVDIRVLLHRTASYPVVTLVLGPPAALRVPSPSQLVAITLDAGAEGSDRDALVSLAASFDLVVDVIARGNRIRRFRLTAPISDNVDYILRAVEDHLRVVAATAPPSYVRAVEEVLADGFDLIGVEHPEHTEFRDDKLAQLETAQHLRRAIAMARRFVRPSREDYLVCTRGFPLARWRELRRHVLESAVTWGMWVGPELAQIAVSEGLARSRRDLVIRLDQGFEALRRHPTAFDIDNDAAEDNLKALADEATALGVELSRPPNGAWASDESSVVSGSIGGAPPKGPVHVQTVDELVALLEDRQQRVTAALELCERGDPRAAQPVIAAAKKMSRAEAVRVLGMSVRFGQAAAQPLLEGLGSSKAFLRHGCALALALLRTESGTLAVIELLINEPTEIWREVARAIGQVGPMALMPLASIYGRLGDRATSAIAERVAWAMAHVGVRGGQGAIEQMAHGQSVVAPVAVKALELLASAANDQVRVRPGALNGSQPGRDVTVNRAFSRRFFEALEQGVPEAGHAALADLDASGPMEMLDESDLIEESASGDDESELDESDLIQT